MKYFLLIALAFLTVLHPSVLSQKSDPACSYWRKEICDFNTEGQERWEGRGMAITCAYHKDKCEQFDCNGHFSTPGIGNFDFCWGIIMNHCDNPISMDVQVVIDALNISFNQRVTHESHYPLPGLKKAGLPLNEYLEFSMEKNGTNIDFGVKLATKMCFPGTHFCSFPSNLKIEILPKQTVPVSSCKNVQRTTMPPQRKCSKTISTDNGCGVPVPKPLATTPAPVNVTAKSKTFKKNCKMGVFPSMCGPNEMCVRGICACQPQNILCPATGYCETVVDCRNKIIPQIIPSVIINEAQKNTPPKTKTTTKKTALIVGGTLGGIILIVLIVGVVLIIRKKRNADNRSFQLLLTEDDTDGII